MKKGSRQCEACGRLIEFDPTDQLCSSKGDTTRLEYHFASRTVLPVVPVGRHDVAGNGFDRSSRPPIRDDDAPATLPRTGRVSTAFCRKCEAEIQTGTRFCPLCGASQTPPLAHRLKQGWGERRERLRDAGRKAAERVNHSKSEWLPLVAPGIGALCVLAGLTTPFWGTSAGLPPEQAATVVHLRGIEWLLLAVSSLVGGLYFKR